MIPHDYTEVIGFWEEHHRDKVPFSLLPIKGPCYQHDLSHEECSSRFYTVKLLFPPVSLPSSLEGSYYGYAPPP